MIRAQFNTGRIVLAQRWGSVATPLDSFTSSTGKAFTLPASIVVPANSIPDHCRVYVHAMCKRTGANATGQFDAWLGTANTNGDSLLTRVSMNATDGHVGRLDGAAAFNTSTSMFFGNGVSSPQNSAASGSSIGDKSTNVDRTAVMYVNLGMSSANALDTFALIGYLVYIDR